jgi:hypothetical protein
VKFLQWIQGYVSGGGTAQVELDGVTLTTSINCHFFEHLKI